MALELDSITQRFGREVALQGISLAVEPGRCVGLLGPNGSGKTTLLRIALGLLIPSAGEVRIDGVPALLDVRAARARVGGALETPSFLDGLDASTNLARLARLAGATR